MVFLVRHLPLLIILSTRLYLILRFTRPCSITYLLCVRVFVVGDGTYEEHQRFKCCRILYPIQNNTFQFRSSGPSLSCFFLPWQQRVCVGSQIPFRTVPGPRQENWKISCLKFTQNSCPPDMMCQTNCNLSILNPLVVRCVQQTLSVDRFCPYCVQGTHQCQGWQTVVRTPINPRRGGRPLLPPDPTSGWIC